MADIVQGGKDTMVFGHLDLISCLSEVGDLRVEAAASAKGPLMSRRYVASSQICHVTVDKLLPSISHRFEERRV